MKSVQRYINREISWLSFNERVLQEAEDPNTPLLERLRFIGIFSNNLDEFFRVRVATVRRMVDFGSDRENLLGELTPVELRDQIQEIVNRHQRMSYDIFQHLIKELAKEGIYFINEKELTHSQGVAVRKYFHDKVFPNLVPIMLNKNMKFPYLRDRSVYLAVKLSKQQNPEKFAYALVRIPSKTASRFIVLPEADSKKYVMWLDDVIRYCLGDIFAIFSYDKLEAYTIKVTRDAELDIDDDISKSFLEKMELGLKKRKHGRPVRLIYDKGIPKDFLDFITRKMKIDKENNTVAGGRYHNHRDLMKFPEIGKPHHYYQTLQPIRHKALRPNQSILKVIRQKDIMLHYPYQTFGHFIDLMREAAIDPKVKEIGITIYRVAEDSKVVNALLNAIRNGKKVTVVIELQARFDEEANIFWSEKLQEEGAHIINGISGLKVHSKLAWIKREEKAGFRNYAYIGTGNFHEGTAQVYADKGLLTTDPRLADEVAHVFEFFKHNFKHFKYKHLIVSPFYMRDFFCEQIDNEIKLAKEGKRAYMVLKMNSLIDPGMMDKLYEAAQAGVKIKLIVRGIFGMKTGIQGWSENIQAISIVDKYLEHSRVFMFGNGGDERFFISSADWMPRNLNRRIEVACPIYDKRIKQELREMLRIQLKDNTKARILDPGLSNNYNREGLLKRFRAQEDYYNYIKSKHYMSLKIYHNPRCAKSRAGLEYLEKKGLDLEIKKYLVDGISVKELKGIIAKTGRPVSDFVRTQEKEYKKNYKGKNLTGDEWIKILAENPKLLQRPIVVNGNRAVLAQPPEEVDKIV
ncbi:MAG: polyphosphate kinase 1 [Chlorobi bacterium]|nr:polyphosphate kinase 1 [Chlorobiota bacterium]